MPYIPQILRDRLDGPIRDLVNALIDAASDPDGIEGWRTGEVNYVVSKLLRLLLGSEPQNFSNMNEMIGMLECVKLELYRQVVAPYENEKIRQHGDL